MVLNVANPKPSVQWLHGYCKTHKETFWLRRPHGAHIHVRIIDGLLVVLYGDFRQYDFRAGGK